MKKVLILLLIVCLFVVSCEQTSRYEDLNPTYILNKNTLVYHDFDCKYLPDDKNQVEIEYNDIEHNSKWRPCGHCKPQ